MQKNGTDAELPKGILEGKGGEAALCRYTDICNMWKPATIRFSLCEGFPQMLEQLVDTFGFTN